MRRSVRWLVLPAFLIVGLAMPVSVSAFPLSTCTLSLESRAADGTVIDIAQSGTTDSNVNDPFNVEWDGTVAYDGSTNVVIKNYTYQVSVFGIPTPIRGSGTNDEENTDGNNTVGVGANSPFGRVAGLYFVSGTYQGEGGGCAGSGWFRLLGSPIGTVPWILALVFAVLGLLGLYRGAQGHTMTGVVGGFLVGAGVALLLITHSLLPAAEQTPALMVAAGTAIGVIISFLGRRGRRGVEPVEPGPA